MKAEQLAQRCSVFVTVGPMEVLRHQKCEDDAVASEIPSVSDGDLMIDRRGRRRLELCYGGSG